MRDMTPIWDGDSPFFAFPFVSATGVPKDTSLFAAEFYFFRVDTGALVAVRPGIAKDARAGGILDVPILGSLADWAGGGMELTVKPVLYLMKSEDGAAEAANMLLNVSMETDTDADGLPDEWVRSAGSSATLSRPTNTPAPNSIYGYPLNASQPAASEYLYAVSTGAAPVAGELFSAGVWARTYNTSGAQGSDFALMLAQGSGGTLEYDYVPFPVTTTNWRFHTVAHRVAQSLGGTLLMELRLASANMSGAAIMFDDPFFFRGRWLRFPAEARRLKVLPRSRPPKVGGNLLAGTGSFEEDSDGDGFPDGWTDLTGGAHSFALDKTPANVAHGDASLKMTLAQATSRSIQASVRGDFKAGETVKATVSVKTDGTLTGTGVGFLVLVKTEQYDGVGATQSAGSSNFGMTIPTYTDFSVQLTLARDVNMVSVAVNLNNVAGTAWIDNVRLTRV
jgi:hypothetical protein